MLSHIQKLPSGAVFSKCQNYRYVLWRTEIKPWTVEPYVLFIGLNPSTADESNDDPTIRRCKQFAKDWGYSSFCMANLFAFRATKPADMKLYAEPVGLANDQWLCDLAANAGAVVCAWGVNGSHEGRDLEVKELLENQALKCFGLTKSGKPKHPLYLKGDTELIPFS